MGQLPHIWEAESLSEVPIRTRLSARKFDTFERMALAEGKKIYSATQEAIDLWIRVRLGSAKERARILQELADLESRETAALAEFLAKRKKDRERVVAEVQVTQEKQQLESLRPAERVVVHLDGGRIQDALNEFNRHSAQTAREVILDHVRKQPGLPGAEEFLAQAEPLGEP